MKALKTFVSGVIAGIFIAIGGTAFLSLENKVLGAMFFTSGLFVICTLSFSLYTGKVCYVFERNRRYLLDVLLIWTGNFCGTWLTAQAERATRIGNALAEKAAILSTAKINDTLLSVFILAIFCNILIYIAVEGYNRNPHELGKYLSLFFGVIVFILSGFEHCVANMYYFSMAGMWSGKMLLYLLVMTLGNAVGGVFLPLVRNWMAKTNKA